MGVPAEEGIKYRIIVTIRKKDWEKLKCTLTEKWIRGSYYIDKMKYSAALKTNVQCGNKKQRIRSNDECCNYVSNIISRIKKTEQLISLRRIRTALQRIWYLCYVCKVIPFECGRG